MAASMCQGETQGGHAPCAVLSALMRGLAPRCFSHTAAAAGVHPELSSRPVLRAVSACRALMERLVAKLVEDGIPTITLYAEPNVVRARRVLSQHAAGQLMPDSGRS